MGQLTNQYVSSSYQGLLKMTDSTTGVTGTLQTVQTGDGTNTPLQISQTEVNISGTFTVNGAPVSVNTGSLVTTSSFNAYTSSVNSKLAGLDVETGSLQLQINSKLDSSSFNSYTSSNDSKVNSLISQTGSYVTETESGSFLITGSVAGDTLTFTKGNGSQFSLQVNTGSLPAGVVSGSAQVAAFGYATTSSVTSLSSSIATTDLNQNNVIAGLATTSSLTSLSSSIASTDLAQNNRLTSLEGVTGSINRNGLITTGSVGGNQSITGSLNVEGTITATSASFTYINTVYETASVIYSSGSNQFGDASNDTQTLWGTVNLPSGSLNVTGATTIGGPLYVNDVATTFQVVGNGFGQAYLQNPAGAIVLNPGYGGVEVLGANARFKNNGPTYLGDVPSGSTSPNYVTWNSSSQQLEYTTPTSINTGSFATTGSNQFNGNQSISGSLVVSSSFTASGLDYPTVDGLVGQVIETDGAGNLSFDDVHTLLEDVRSGEAITKGDPLYISGSQGARPIVYKADASNTAKMPVTYVALETVGSNTDTRGIVLGLIEGMNLTGYNAGDAVYVAEGGGWSTSRPSGSASITQLLGVVTKGGAGGKGMVLNPGPATLPTLPTGKLWIGNGSNQPITQSISEIGLAITGSNNFIGTENITGSLNVSGSLNVVGPVGLNLLQPNNFKQNLTLLGGINHFTSSTVLNNYLNSITTSLNNNDNNFVLPPGAGISSAFGISILTGSVFISGSNNLILNLGSNTAASQGRKQIYGSANIGITAPNINTSSLTVPQINNNYNAGALTLTLTTGSNVGNNAHTFGSNINLSNITWNHPSASIGAGASSTVGNNVNVGTITSTTTGPTVLTAASTLSNNLISNASIALNNISSSIQTTNNIIGGNTITFNNRYYTTGSNNFLANSSNIFAGQALTITAAGAPSTNVSRTLVGNIIGGQTINVSLEANNTDNGGLRNSLVYGQGLNITGSHSATSTDLNSMTLLGRWNGEDNGLADSARTVFAVGTGTATGTRRTSLYVTSGSLVGISGSAVITGSVQGNVLPLTVTSNTASLNLNNGNFFVLALTGSLDIRIEPSNIKPGQTVNLKLNTTGSGTVSFPTSVLQQSGSAYVPTTTVGTDIITMVSFDSTNLFLANVKNLI